MQSEEFYQMQIKYYKDEYENFDLKYPISNEKDIYLYLNPRTKNEDYLIITNYLKDNKVIPKRIMSYIEEHNLLQELEYLSERIRIKKYFNRQLKYFVYRYKSMYPNSSEFFLKSICK